MPTASGDGVSLYYETAGSGETVAFVGDAGLGAWQWGHQFEGVAGPRQALVWDYRGVGRSDDPPGPVDVDVLAGDLEAVLADAGVDRAHLVGAGLGGMVALRYARAYSRARSLALFGTAASGEEFNEAALRALHPVTMAADAVRASLEGAFSAPFLEGEDLVGRILDWRREEDATGEALEFLLAATLGFEAGPLHEVVLPTTVFHGVDDPVGPASAGEALADGLPRAEFVPVEGRHLAHFEHGPAVTDRLVTFLESVE